MYRRASSSTDGKHITRDANTLFKPFKPPSLSTPQPAREQPQRKRRRISYKDQQGSGSDDDDPKGKKKKGKKDGTYVDPDMLTDIVNINKMYPVFKPKPFEQVSSSRFCIPGMKNAAGEVITHAVSGVSLGIRPQAQLIPRPLHDPMAEHAIVLYDPTTDARETDEERKERLLEEEKEARKKALEQERASSDVGILNPHKSLRELLGGGTVVGKKKAEKVPVVIDPRLTTILRPHQIEGVQVGI
jgi:DNA repair and recombination protein RAD54 and RAD54-like protein